MLSFLSGEPEPPLFFGEIDLDLRSSERERERERSRDLDSCFDRDLDRESRGERERDFDFDFEISRWLQKKKIRCEWNCLISWIGICSEITSI